MTAKDLKPFNTYLITHRKYKISQDMPVDIICILDIAKNGVVFFRRGESPDFYEHSADFDNKYIIIKNLTEEQNQ